MGCDGGTIPKRDELVRTKKKAEQKDKQAELAFRWRHCAITQQPLQKPIVACQLGRLYSKEAVIEALLDKSKFSDATRHIKSLKDIKELKLTENPAYKGGAKTSETYDDSLATPFICPVTGLEMSGNFRFVFSWHCGCVISERGHKAVNAKLCHKCLEPISEDDVIVLNGGEEDVKAAQEKIEIRKLKAKTLKKNKSKGTAESNQPSTSSSASSSGIIEKASSITSSLGKPATATSSIEKLATVTKKPEGTKRPGAVSLVDPQFKKTKGDYSVAKDPKATEVYKSLFTSHESAAKQDRAHWITYNPFYN